LRGSSEVAGCWERLGDSLAAGVAIPAAGGTNGLGRCSDHGDLGASCGWLPAGQSVEMHRKRLQGYGPVAGRPAYQVLGVGPDPDVDAIAQAGRLS
jgi:hypothetical protein